MSRRTPNRLPWPARWAPVKRLRWLAVLGCIAVVGVAGLAVGAADLAAGDTGMGAFLVGVGAASAFVLSQAWLKFVRVRTRGTHSIRLGPVPGGGEAAVVLPYSRAQFWGWAYAVGLFVVGGLGAVAWSLAQEPPHVLIALAGVCAAAYGGASATEFARGRVAPGYVALSPSGIHHRSWAVDAYVPWHNVVAVDAVDRQGPTIVVTTMINGGGWVRRTSWWWKQSELGSAPHLAIVGQYLSVDPALAYHALRFNAAAPSARAELGTPAAVERLHRIDVAPPPDPAGPHDELGMAWRARPGPDPRPSD